jgi:predicted DNA-binding protein YlxM (UPF0122 family)
MKKIVLLLSVLAVFVVVGCGKKGTVVAKVDGKEITMQDLDDEIANLPPQYKMFASDPGIKKNILDNLILNKVLMNYADKNGITTKKEVAAKITEQENSLKTEIESQLVMLNRQKEKISELAKKDIVMKEIFETGDFSKITVSDAEIKDAYEKYSARMKSMDPKAKVQPMSEIKDGLSKSVARQKWVEQLKAAAKIDINEKAFELPAAPAALQQAPQVQRRK